MMGEWHKGQGGTKESHRLKRERDEIAGQIMTERERERERTVSINNTREPGEGV